MRQHYTYQNRANRDAKYSELVSQYGRDRVWSRSACNQQLHPEYVADWEGPVERGLGNTQYQTFFAVLYIVEVR